MEEMVIKLRNKLAEFGVQKGSSILIAYSGGKDSSVLLDFLSVLNNELEMQLGVAYINHNLRGNESIEEESFVRNNVIANYNLPLYVKVAQSGSLESQKGESVESAARKLRYDFFKEIVEKYNYKYIATAHNFNDRIETFFINILRGGGSETLNSIPAVNGKIIRPLLDITREEIENYIHTNHISFIEDSSNQTNLYKRNIIRHDIVPALHTVSSNMVSSFETVFKHIDEDTDYIKSCAEVAFKEIIRFKWGNVTGIDRIAFNTLHPAIRSRVIKKLFDVYGEISGLNQGLINALVTQNRIKLVKGRLYIESKGKFLWFYKVNNKIDITCTIDTIPFKNELYHIDVCDTGYDYYPVFNSLFFPLTIETINENDEIMLAKGRTNIVKRLGERGIPKNIALQGCIIRDSNKTIVVYCCGPFFEAVNKSDKTSLYYLKTISSNTGLQTSVQYT
ncbi:MAG: tRNA lysidine(34) synthetase TilS [Spirochaetes bacterium GWF1_31_7]|nr:MAG: tRNA lysidine(34) synthetase TilS [Spirochaetes bacterium GWF1_31_7]OHD47479.1 MAG: tRNA lysidine(34) synthetase TilS [Spirochaetes bacterium GWE2_31_10]OHD74249.1 MAG: tRNA lysidine(34) synthetase TilS [Spirochaetes bacterium RIFOXYB1_FULL_32_8]